ncbi:MAG: AEC family transporter [Angelakisella sp.]
MVDVLLKSFSFILLIAIGYFWRSRKVFGDRDYQVLTRVVMNITLPAAIITGFAGLTVSAALLLVMLLGLLCNIALLALGWFVTRGKPNAHRAFVMMNYAGYNIGAFAIPFLQVFLGPAGVVTACMFDAGNAMLCTGGSYAITSAITSPDGEKFRLRPLFKKLFSSVTFDVYLVVMLAALLGVTTPDWLLRLLAPASAANAGVAMLMIGLMFRWSPKPGYLRAAVGTVAIRTLFGAAVAVLVCLFAPFSNEGKQVVSILLFAPISIISTAYTEQCGGDAGLAGFTNSLSIVVSIVIITSIVLVMS